MKLFLIACLATFASVPPAWADDVPGTLHLSSRPATAVEIDGVAQGTTEDTRRGVELPAGTYTVRFVCESAECAGFRLRTGKKTLVVEAGGRTRYHADFYALNKATAPDRPTPVTDDGPSDEPVPLVVPAKTTADLAPAEGAPAGTLKLSSQPNAQVYIGGSYVGTTDDLAAGLRLPPGEHAVRFVCAAPECEDLRRRSGKKTLVLIDGAVVAYEADFFRLNDAAP